MFSGGFTYGRISMVDDLTHEVGKEDRLSNDGEPGEQVTGAQSEQLRRHLQHGEPQQPHCGLNLMTGDRVRQHPPRKTHLTNQKERNGCKSHRGQKLRQLLLTSPSSLSVSPLEEFVFPLRCLFLCLCLLLCRASTSHRSFMLRDGLIR